MLCPEALPPRPAVPAPPSPAAAPGGGEPLASETPKAKSPDTVWPSSPSATQCTWYTPGLSLPLMAAAICWPPAVDLSFPRKTERPPGPLSVTAEPLGTDVSEKARVSVDGDPGTIDPGAGAEVTSSGWAAATAGP